MVNTHGQYKSSGQALLSGLQRSIRPSMVGNHHEENDKEDSMVRFSWLE
jgi:hypothetical protein